MDKSCPEIKGGEAMKEIGGYIELDTYRGKMLHEKAVALNCGRNALAYLIKSKSIKRILLPCFLCSSVMDVCKRENTVIRYYSVGMDFLPSDVHSEKDEWLYIVNFYGQLSNQTIRGLKQKYGNIIVDNAQSYFQMPVDGIDTLYTCRKYFGVVDGAFLYTDLTLDEVIPTDESFDRMRFLLGRFERTASEFYGEYSANNHFFADEPIKQMSKLTYNLLHGIDYDFRKKRRTENFAYLHEHFKVVNKLSLTVPDGAFMYPLYIENGAEIRKKLQAEKIYIPTLWPDVFKVYLEDQLEYDMALNILPLPIDQRYDLEDMKYMIDEVIKCIG